MKYSLFSHNKGATSAKREDAAVRGRRPRAGGGRAREVESGNGLYLPPQKAKKGKGSKDCHLQSVHQKLRSFEGHIFGFHLQEDHMYYSAS